MKKSRLQLCGTTEPNADLVRRANAVWKAVAPPEYVKYGHKGMRTKHKGTKRSPARAKDGAGLTWLKQFRDYQGDECLLYPFRTASSPQGSVTYGARRQSAPRIMCMLAHKSPPEGKTWALHKCGNGHLGCVNPNHLYWGDRSDNQKDAARHTKEGKPEADSVPATL